MTRRATGFGLGLLLLTFGCGGVSHIPLDRPLPASVEATAPATVLEHVTEHVLLPRDRSAVTMSHYYYATRIHTAAGLDAANHSLRIGPGETLRYFEAQVISPTGRRERYGRSALQRLDVARISGPGGYTISDYVLSMPGASVGATLEVSYTVTRDYLLANHDVLFASEHPVRRAEMIVNIPTWMTVDLRSRGLTEKRLRASGRQVVSYVARELPGAGRSEPMRGPPWRAAPCLRWSLTEIGAGRGPAMTYNQSWPDALRATRERFEQDLREARDLPKLSLPPRPQAAAEAAWRWVRERVVARPPTWLPGDTQPLTLAQRLTRGVATPDEMARLTIGLLARAGVDVVPVLVPGASHLDAAEDFPSRTAERYDVLVLADPRKQAYIDPYCDGCLVGELSAAHQGRVGIELRREGDRITSTAMHETPSLHFPRGAATSWMRLFVGPEHVDVEEIGLKLRGGAAAGLRHLLAEHPHSERWQARLLERGFVQRVVGGRAEAECIDEQCILRMRGGRLQAAGLSRAGARAFVSMADAFPEAWLSRYSPERSSPLVFSADRGFEHRLRVKVGPGARFSSLAGTRLRSPFGEYRQAVTTTGGTHAELEESLSVDVAKVSVADYAAWRAFLARVRAARRRVLVIDGLAAPSAAAPAAPEPGGPGGPRPGGPRSEDSAAPPAEADLPGPGAPRGF